MADKPGFNFDTEGAWIAKDPSAKKDYTIDFSKWLKDGDTITSVVWSVEVGLTKHLEGNTATTAFISLSGGVLGRNYLVNAHIVTADSLEDDKSFRIVIRDN